MRFYAWLLGIWPKEWTHRYATFIRPDAGDGSSTRVLSEAVRENEQRVAQHLSRRGIIPALLDHGF